jgi:hypothetical protein
MYLQHIDGAMGAPEAFIRQDLEDAAFALRNAYVAAFMDKTSSSCTLTGIDAVGNSTPGTGPLIETSDTEGTYPVVGTNTGGTTANNVTLAIKLGTGLGGRSYHGRFYFVGVGPGLFNSTQPNQLKTASFGDFNSAGSDFLAGLNDGAITNGNIQLVVASFVTGGTDRIPAIATRVASVSLTDGTFDSQRRRLPGRGT